jgi:hypothetical protein
VDVVVAAVKAVVVISAVTDVLVVGVKTVVVARAFRNFTEVSTWFTEVSRDDISIRLGGLYVAQWPG